LPSAKVATRWAREPSARLFSSVVCGEWKHAEDENLVISYWFSEV
jgi:hypothetical protein